MPDINQLDILLNSLDDIQAQNIKVIDVRGQTSVTDYMIVASGRASRHVKAIADKLMQDMKAAGVRPLSAEGMEQGDWALIDFGDYVVHIMQPESREYYNIEGLWEGQ